MEEKAKIIYQDKDILVLNKKSGVVCTREGRNDKDTLEDWLVEKLGDNDLPRKGIVHRLDKGTSGLMVVVRTKEARNTMLEMFKKREIKKTYLALIEGDLSREGEIKVPIARSKYVFGKFAVSEEGKMAETSFKLVKKYNFDDKVYSLIERWRYGGVRDYWPLPLTSIYNNINDYLIAVGVIQLIGYFLWKKKQK